MLLPTIGFSQGLMITEVVDPNDQYKGRYVELYNNSNSEINLELYKISAATNGSSSFSQNVNLDGTLKPGHFYICGYSTSFVSYYNIPRDDSGFSANGDDVIAIRLKSDNSVIDILGVLGVDGTGTSWEYEDGRAERKIGQNPSSTFDANDWNIDNDSGGGNGPQNLTDMDAGYWIGAENVKTFVGASGSSSFDSASNWSSGTVPDSNDLILIRNGSESPVINSNENINDLYLYSGSSLTISKGFSLKVNNDFTNNGTLTLNSDNDEYSSLIVQGASSGNVTYNRWINSISSAAPTSSDPGWDLVGSPVVGASLTSSNFSENSGNYAIQPYDNSDNSWTSTNSASVSTSLGTGYAMAKATAGTEAFTGTVETSDKDVAIVNNSSGSGTQWNLVSNPYPSYLALNSAAESASSATSNFITQNAITTDVLGSGTNEDALWYWKGFEYGQYNNSHTAKYIAPGQGFFVASKTGGGNLKFLESMQTTTGGDDFIAGDIMEDNRGELFISLNQNDLLRETEIYFIENTTDGSDPTYDARTFPMNDNSTSVFTRLVEGDEGVDLAIQSLAYSEMWDKVIPLGINALGGEEMTISISHRTTPSNIYSSFY